jgi:hypothetical protein
MALRSPSIHSIRDMVSMVKKRHTGAMTRKETRDYLARWRLVNKMLEEELRHTPLREKLKQIDACYRTAVGLGLLPKLLSEKRRSEREVWSRWRRLRKITL